MMKIFRKIHLWLSVPFGIFITLICFSGAMLVFEPEITRAMNRNIYYVSEAGESPLPMGRLMEAVRTTLPDSVRITGVTVFADKERAYQVNLSKPRRAALFIDQYSGEIRGRYERNGFFSTMFRLHRWLLDSADPHGDGVKTGRLIVGISTLIFVIALITGIIIWVPRVRKGGLRRSLSISFSGGRPGFWKGLHVAGGMYAVVLVLAMSLTGLTWSFDWYRKAFYAVCGVEHTPRSVDRPPQQKSGKEDETERRGQARRGGRGHGHGQGEERRHGEFGRWQKVYDQLSADYPDAPQITVGPETATVTLGESGNVRAADVYKICRRSGEVSRVTAYSEAAGGAKLRGWIYSVHTGAFGGIFTRILWFLGALLGASLPLTGYYIWIRHLRKKRLKR